VDLQRDRVLIGRIADDERTRFSACVAEAVIMPNTNINTSDRTAYPPMDEQSWPGAARGRNNLRVATESYLYCLREPRNQQQQNREDCRG
jgi:hypothetical protein